MNNLTICGVGGRARIFAGGNNAGGKGTWVMLGLNTTVDSVEFHDAKVPDQNGAGIRADGGDLTVKNCGFFNNENGILGGSTGSKINIERSEFARNGFGDGFTHNIYISTADKLVVTASFFHEAKVGHNLKSRAKETRIENSYFMDGPTGTASYLADFPNGGVVYLRGNMFHKGPLAENSAAIAYGQEGLTWSTNTLEMVHNTAVSTRSGGTFIVSNGGAQSVRLTANLFAGTNGTSLLSGGFLLANAIVSGNVTSTATNIPGASNVTTPSFWPNATLLGQIGLSNVPDAGYAVDAPVPLKVRTIVPSGRVSGALQSSP